VISQQFIFSQPVKTPSFVVNSQKIYLQRKNPSLLTAAKYGMMRQMCNL